MIVVFVTLSVLSSVGVEIGPLLAGAGVVGIAIGFGAQTLVGDIFLGRVLLIDDAFRVGEYIEIDSKLIGTVEAISVRSMRLRHHRGVVHILPFGELRSITNRSRGRRQSSKRRRKQPPRRRRWPEPATRCATPPNPTAAREAHRQMPPMRSGS